MKNHILNLGFNAFGILIAFGVVMLSSSCSDAHTATKVAITHPSQPILCEIIERKAHIRSPRGRIDFIIVRSENGELRDLKLNEPIDPNVKYLYVTFGDRTNRLSEASYVQVSTDL